MKELIKKLERNKGISLITLTVAVTILIIITGTLIYSAKDTIEVRNLKNMYNDIELLEDKVEAYYTQYRGIPANIKYDISKNSEFQNFINGLENKIDAGKYYVINLDYLEGITSLNYGRDYDNVKDKKELTAEDYSKYTDIYIINEVSHQIYYVRGVESDRNRYYTNELKTKEDIDMRITIIDSIEDLVRFEQKVNGTYYNEEKGEYDPAKPFEGENVVLTRNLDFEDNNSYDGTDVTIGRTPFSFSNTTNNIKTYLCEGGTGWTPIGNYQSNSETTNDICFSGTFEGNKYQISNIYINETTNWGSRIIWSH